MIANLTQSCKVIWNLHVLLGMFLVSLVLGNTSKQVSTCQGGSVLLSCPCNDRDASKPFRWQMKNLVVFKQEDHYISEMFKDRVELFYFENPSNCSILLKNIIQRDHGIYKCYYQGKTLTYHDVNLHVYGATNATQPANCSFPEPSPISSMANKEMHWLIVIPVGLGLLLLALLAFLLWKPKESCARGSVETADAPLVSNCPNPLNLNQRQSSCHTRKEGEQTNGNGLQSTYVFCEPQ